MVNNYHLCPKCGTALSNIGECSSCGYSANSEDVSLEELAKRKLQKDLGNKTEESPEDVKRERDELKDQMTVMALKSFEHDVGELVASQPKEKANEILEYIGDSPEKLEQLKASIHAKGLLEKPEDDGTEKVPPAGLAKAYKPAQKETVEDLYDVLSSNTSTVEEKRIANAKLDKLWKKSLENKKVAKRAIRELTEGE